MGQLPQPRGMFPGQRLLGPLGGAAGYRVEIFEREQPATRTIVVAANEYRTKAANPLDDFIGIGRVADRVAEVPDSVMRRCGGEDCFQRVKVRMNVGQDESAHENSQAGTAAMLQECFQIGSSCQRLSIQITSSLELVSPSARAVFLPVRYRRFHHHARALPTARGGQY